MPLQLKENATNEKLQRAKKHSHHGSRDGTETVSRTVAYQSPSALAIDIKDLMRLSSRFGNYTHQDITKFIGEELSQEFRVNSYFPREKNEDFRVRLTRNSDSDGEVNITVTAYPVDGPVYQSDGQRGIYTESDPKESWGSMWG